MPIVEEEEGINVSHSYKTLTRITGNGNPRETFFDADGTLTKAFYDYIVKNNLLSHLH